MTHEIADRRTVCVIQARLQSSRLPNKVLARVGGRSLLAHVIERAQATEGIDDVVVATTINPEDTAVCDEAAARGASVFRGDQNDVLDRFYRVASEHRANAVVRLTADCPLVDPVLNAEVIARFWRNRLDYCSNVIPATFPDGLSVEVMSFHALERSWLKATRPSDREHVTTYIRTHLSCFRTENVEAPKDYSHLRWTVDEPEDLGVVRRIFILLDASSGEFPAWTTVLSLVEQHPEISRLNARYRRYEGWERSRAIDPRSD